MPLPSRQTTPAERTVDPRLARRAASERIKTESARSTPALGSPGLGPVRGGSAASGSSSARAAAEPYQMLDMNRFSDSQLKKAANKFDTARREGSLKLIKPNDWPKCERCVPKQRQIIRCVDCRLEKDRKEFSDAMRAKDRAAVCKKCQAAAVDKEDMKRREDYVIDIEADPWASVDPGGGNSSDSDLEADPVPPAHFDAAAAYRVHDAGGAGGGGRGTQLAPVWDDDEDEW
ncbi:hypothetical protein JCM10296v2_000646 [Rhodotorula toruloides]